MSLRYNVGVPVPTSAPQSLIGSLIGTFPFGPDTSGDFVISVQGLAVRRADGSSVSLDAERDVLLNVTALVVPGVDPGVFWMPVPLNAIQRGAIIMSAGADPSPLFVLDVEDETHLVCLDPSVGELITYSPPINPLLNGYAVAFSLYDLLLRGPEDRALPFGGGGGGGGFSEMLPLLLLFGQGGLGGTAAATPGGAPNPLLLLALLGGGMFGGDDRDDDAPRRFGPAMLLPLLLLGGIGGTTGLISQPVAPTPGTVPAPAPNPMLPLLILAMSGGLGGLFGEGPEGADGPGGALLPLLLLTASQGGAAGGTSGGLSALLPLLLLSGSELFEGGSPFGGGEMGGMLPLLLLSGLGAPPSPPAATAPAPPGPPAPVAAGSTIDASMLALLAFSGAFRRSRRGRRDDDDRDADESAETSEEGEVITTAGAEEEGSPPFSSSRTAERSSRRGRPGADPSSNG